MTQDGRDDDEPATPQPFSAVGRPSVSGTAPTAQRSALHRVWRNFDENYMKPWFGGRSRMWEAVRHSEELTADGADAPADNFAADADEPIRYALFERMNTSSHFHGSGSGSSRQLRSVGLNPMDGRSQLASVYEPRSSSKGDDAGGNELKSRAGPTRSQSTRSGNVAAVGAARDNRASPMLLGNQADDAMLLGDNNNSDGI